MTTDPTLLLIANDSPKLLEKANVAYTHRIRGGEVTNVPFTEPRWLQGGIVLTPDIAAALLRDAMVMDLWEGDNEHPRLSLLPLIEAFFSDAPTPLAALYAAWLKVDKP